MARFEAALMAALVAMSAGLTAAKAVTGAQQSADEADMLARARAERQFGSRDVFGPREAGAIDRSEQVRQQAIDAEVDRRVEEAERQAELDAISARLGRLAGGRTESSNGSPLPDRAGTVQLPTQPQLSPRLNSHAHAEVYGAYGAPAGELEDALPVEGVSTRATILLVMTPGDRGIRRYNPSADPILCIGETCWISRGLKQDAKSTRRAKAFGPVNTLGERAGACNGSVRCVFRNVDLGSTGATIQPVDLRLMRHDRRESMRIEIDRSCQMVGGAIHCGAPQSGADYVMWAIPEAVAAAAGADVIAAFLQPGRLAGDRRLAGNR